MSAEYTRLVAFLFCTGCGALADGFYNGEPLVTLRGQVFVDESIGLDDQIGVALLWSNSEEPDMGSQSVVVSTEFPARYTIEVFRPPPAESQFGLLGNDAITAGIGEVILFLDQDRDGLWDSDNEEVVGGSFGRALLWLSDESQSAEPPPGLEWVPGRAGFHVVSVSSPDPCTGSEFEVMRPLDHFQMDLRAGNFSFEGNLDWDCDGESDWLDGQFAEECPPDEQIAGDCEFYQTVLEELAQEGDIDITALEAGLYADCLLEQCPELVDVLLTLDDPPPPPLPPQPDLVIQPSPDWCLEVNSNPGEGVVVAFAPGTYEGACDFVGFQSHYRAEDPNDWPVFETDGAGIRVLGANAFLQNLQILGRLELTGEFAVVDDCHLYEVYAENGFNLQYSQFFGPADLLDGGSVVGNHFHGPATIEVFAGEVSDNRFEAGATVLSEVFERNLVFGQLFVQAQVTANVIVGGVMGEGSFVGNTVVGEGPETQWSGDFYNNALTSEDPLGHPTNVVCDDACYTDIESLDLTPTPVLTGLAESAALDGGDFCGQDRGSFTVGAFETGYTVGSLYEHHKVRGLCEMTPLPQEEPPEDTDDPEADPPPSDGCSITGSGAGVGLIGALFLAFRRKSCREVVTAPK